jgi:hypothetical protein
VAAPRNQIEQDLLAMLQAEQRRNSSVQGSGGLPDIPPELFGEQAPQKMQRQAAAALSPDAYLDFLCPPSPGRNVNVAEISLDALWSQPAALPVQASEEDPLASLWATAAPAPVKTSETDLSQLWNSSPSAEPDLDGLWDAPGRATAASDAGDALSGLFMNGDAVAQAEMTGQTFEAGEIPMPSRTASSRGNFDIEFDTGMDFDAPVRPTGGGSAPRFRIDQPPPRSTFNRGNVTAQDGVVVGQRGTDGRFQRTAAAQPAPARTPPIAHSPPRSLPSTQTKYDVLRKGGLDL